MSADKNEMRLSDEQHKILQDIRQMLRSSMNGITATKMRNSGFDYKYNFGVEYPRLKTIAGGYRKDKNLASEMWKSEVREMKILATLLFPEDELSEEESTMLVKEICNQEIRQYLCINLFQEHPFSLSYICKWVESPDEELRLFAYMLFSRLILANKHFPDDYPFELIVNSAMEDLKEDSNDFNKLRAIINSLNMLLRIRPEFAVSIRIQIENIAELSDEKKEMILSQLDEE